MRTRHRNLMKFNKGKKKGMHRGWTSPTHCSRLRRDCPGQEAEQGFTVAARPSTSPSVLPRRVRPVEYGAA